MFPDKRATNKTFGRPHQLHGFNDHSLGVDREANGAVDEQNSNDDKQGAQCHNTLGNFLDVFV